MEGYQYHLPADPSPKVPTLSSCKVPLRSHFASQPSWRVHCAPWAVAAPAHNGRKSYSLRATGKRKYIRTISYLTYLLPKGAPEAAYLGS